MFVSIVLPTHNRAQILLRTLALYGHQTGLKDDFEVILVDDASCDETAFVVKDAVRTVRYPLVTCRLDRNGGPSHARNVALDLAQGELIVFGGDDILPAADFVARHREWHLHRHPEETAAMVGRITWSPEMPPTALLRWLEDKGTQFHYSDMHDGDRVGPDRFYTSNVSVKRALLTRTGQRFNETLRFCEDSEFATRLARDGMTLYFNAAAHAHHLHPTDLASSLRRMRSLGLAVAAMEQTAPETFDRVTAGVLDRNAGWRGRLIRLVLAAPMRHWIYRPLAALCERRIFADRIFALAHASAVLEGVKQGRKDAAP